MLPCAPPSRSNDASLALVSCLSEGYNLHQFSDVLALVSVYLFVFVCEYVLRSEQIFKKF